MQKVPINDGYCVGGEEVGCTIRMDLSGGMEKRETALAGVAWWLEHQLANQRVSGSIPSQGTCLG